MFGSVVYRSKAIVGGGENFPTGFRGYTVGAGCFFCRYQPHLVKTPEKSTVVMTTEPATRDYSSDYSYGTLTACRTLEFPHTEKSHGLLT